MIKTAYQIGVEMAIKQAGDVIPIGRSALKSLVARLSESKDFGLMYDALRQHPDVLKEFPRVQAQMQTQKLMPYALGGGLAAGGALGGAAAYHHQQQSNPLARLRAYLR